VDTLQHPHSLSVEVHSLEELNHIASRLLEVATPHTCSYSSSHSCLSRSSPDGEQYSLCYQYNTVPLELIEVLGTIRVRYTLHDTLEHKDSLRFWPDYQVPKGTLSFLGLNTQVNKDESEMNLTSLTQKSAWLAGP
jgi:hypothetical protein